MNTDKNTISTTNEIKLVFLYIVYIYLTEIMGVIEPLNSENLLGKYSQLIMLLRRYKIHVVVFFRTFSSSTKFTLSSLSKKFLE